MLTLCSLSSSAQYRLPDSHNDQHNDLLASQKAISSDISVANTLMYLNDLREREEYIDNDIFTNHWESESVNPYSGVTIPASHDIDVSGFVFPLDGDRRVTSHYGYRPRFRRVHRGIDLSLNVGDTVRAAFDGKIRLTKYERKGYGYYVVVRHNNGMETVYGHLSKFLVKPDQVVKAGDPIALGGNTGRSTGPHLHFETRYLGLAINPTAIVDFDNQVTHKDIFTFEKKTYEKSQNYAPKKKATRKKSTASSKKTTSSTAKKSSSSSASKTTTKK